MSSTFKRLNLNIPVEEWDALNAHCKRFSRNKTDVIRQLIRSLPEYQDPESEAIDENGGGVPSVENQG